MLQFGFCNMLTFHWLNTVQFYNFKNYEIAIINKRERRLRINIAVAKSVIAECNLDNNLKNRTKHL